MRSSKLKYDYSSNKYLFVVCMNNSGSTMLHHYLEGCSVVSALPRLISDQATSSEGQYYAQKMLPLPKKHGCKAVFTEMSNILLDESRYDWDGIKKVWHDGWAKSPEASLKDRILLEKSPTNVVRAQMLQKQFPNSYFIIMVRNPYAVSEGIRRRNGYDISRCARHWVEAMKFQKRNLANLKNSILIRYEDMCDHKDKAKGEISLFIPELKDINLRGKFTGHYSIFGKKHMPIKNLNQPQISKLSAKDILLINKEITKQIKLVKYFGYKII